MAHRPDVNQAALLEEVRDAGLSARSTAMVKAGFPDAAIGVPVEPFLVYPIGFEPVRMAGLNLLAEIKNPEQPPSKQRLTPDERGFFATWLGQVDLVKHADYVIALAQALQQKIGAWQRLAREARNDLRFERAIDVLEGRR